MNQLLVIGSTVSCLACVAGSSVQPEALLSSQGRAGLCSEARPSSQVGDHPVRVVEILGPQMDEYPAMRLKAPSTFAPGIIMNVLTAELSREYATLWSGCVRPAANQPDVGVQAHFPSLTELKQQLAALKEEVLQLDAYRDSLLGQRNLIRNSVCDANGEVYGRVLESGARVTLIRPEPK